MNKKILTVGLISALTLVSCTQNNSKNIQEIQLRKIFQTLLLEAQIQVKKISQT